MLIYGDIVGVNKDTDEVLIKARMDSVYTIDRQMIRHAEIRLNDGRTISADQRRKIYATLGDISAYTGYTVEELKDHFKARLLAQTGDRWFSLSNVDMTTANQYLESLINFCLEWQIPTLDTLLDRAPDTSRYLYACLVYKRCCICGGRAELHHWQAVGMGRNRKEICHAGMEAVSLCRTHHTEAHQMGKVEFENRYHVYGIKLDQELCETWKLKSA